MFSRLFGRRDRRASAPSSTEAAPRNGAGTPRSSTGPETVPRASASRSSTSFVAIPDSFETMPEVAAALRKRGLERCALHLAVDFTQSNTWTGKHSFHGRCLHDTAGVAGANPYERVLGVLGRTLVPFLTDGAVSAYGFGDSTTQDAAVFSFFDGGRAAPFEEVLARYRELAPGVALAGPTSLGPAIRAAAASTIASGNAFTLLVIVADGQVTRSADLRPGEVSAQETDSIQAIVDASASAALAVVMVGVGDGPWSAMQAFDDLIPSRLWDNWQFVNYNAVTRSLQRVTGAADAADAAFALACLQEVPAQYETCRRLGLLNRRPTSTPPQTSVRILPPPVRERRVPTPPAPMRPTPASAPPPPSSSSSDASSCAICLCAPRDSVLLPCGHAALCMQCAGDVMRTAKRCPLCRGAVESHHKLFL